MTTGANTYRVGDFVYFDDPTSPDAPYQIRRIDELNRTGTGVEARVVLYMRRRDVPFSLMKIADQASRRFDNYYEVDKKKPENFNARGYVVANGEQKKEEPDGDEVKEVKTKEDAAGESAEPKTKKDDPADVFAIDWGNGGLPLGAEKLTDEQRMKLRQREVFLSRQSEIMPAHQIRGKCRVTLLSEVEECDTYLNADVDSFFYSLVYDMANQTLLADKGAIRVGEKYQAKLEEDEKENGETKVENGESTDIKMDEDDDEANSALQIDEEGSAKSEKPKERNACDEIDRDVQVYHPYHKLTDRDIDQFLILARAVGTFARALDSSSSSKIPTLHMAAACASRDVTIFHAMSLLHHADYDVGKAVSYLVPTANKAHYPLQIDKTTGNQTQTLGGPLLCRDQMEEWSTPEANLFEEALEKCGKDFNDIRVDYLPWKSIRDVVDYYYQYKASTRYCDRKKSKASDSETKLKQVYIPSYNKQTPSVIGTFNLTQSLSKSNVPCENCNGEESQNWYTWGGKGQTRLCQSCWFKWKKNGGLDRKHALERFDKNRPPVVPVTPASASNGIEKERPALQPKSSTSQNALTRPIMPLQKGPNNQALLAAAMTAFERGQITKQQLSTLKISLGVGSGVGVGRTVAKVSETASLSKAKPASKPNILYYTTIWRRAVKRILPKTALNPRKLGRKPFMAIDHEAIIKAVAITDSRLVYRYAQHLGGVEKAHKVSESEFIRVMTHVQHTMSAAAVASNKRPITSAQLTGEPAAKLAKAHFQPLPSTSRLGQDTQPSAKALEAVGNTLLAVHRSISAGQPYLHGVKSRVTPDTKWIDLKQHGLRYVTGFGLKAERRRLISRALIRRVSRQPCQYHQRLDSVLASLIPFFTNR